MSIGATRPCENKHLVSDDDTITTMESDESSNSDYSVNDNEDSDTESESEKESIDFEDDEALEAFMASAAHASMPKGVSSETLSKIWRIDLETARKTSLPLSTGSCPSFRTNLLMFSMPKERWLQPLKTRTVCSYFFISEIC